MAAEFFDQLSRRLAAPARKLPPESRELIELFYDHMAYERGLASHSLRAYTRDLSEFLIYADRQNLAVLKATPYSRYPVYRGSDDDVVGILETKSLAIALTAGGHTEGLFANLGEAVFVPESTPALTLPELFREHNNHMALVVDEYGDLQGLVTRNDVFSAVLGQLAQDPVEDGAAAPIVQREDGSLLVDGSLSSDDLRELMSLSHLPGENTHEYTTAAGMVVTHFGRIPAIGEYFDFGDWRIEVIDLDGARVDKLLIQRHRTAPVLDEPA